MIRFLTVILSIVFIFFENCVCMQVNPEEFRTGIINKNIKIICMKRNTQSETVITKIQNHLDEIFNNLEQQITDNLWTIVIFSEHFWGNADNILNSEEVTAIVAKCNEITSRHQRLIVHINFLHQFDNRELHTRCNWLIRGTVNGADGRICSDQSEDLFAAVGDAHNHVANYSLVIWNNLPIAIYRKSTYHNESNTLVLRSEDKYAYEFGDFQTHPLVDDEIHRQIANFFVGATPLIATRICADMNTRFLENIPNTEHSILIVPANYKRIDSDLKDNIPNNVFVVVCSDTALGVSFLHKSSADETHVIRRPRPIFSINPPCFSGYCQMMNNMIMLDTVESVPTGLVRASAHEIEDVVADDDSSESCFCRLCCCCCKGEYE